MTVAVSFYQVAPRSCPSVESEAAYAALKVTHPTVLKMGQIITHPKSSVAN